MNKSILYLIKNISKVYLLVMFKLIGFVLSGFYSYFIREIPFAFSLVFILKLAFSVFFAFLEDFCGNFWSVFEECILFFFRLSVLLIEKISVFFFLLKNVISNEVGMAKKFFFTKRQLIFVYFGNNFLFFLEKILSILFFFFCDVVTIVVLYHFCAYFKLYLVFCFFFYIYVISPLVYLFFFFFRLFFKFVIRIVKFVIWVVFIWPVKLIIFVMRNILKFLFGVEFIIRDDQTGSEKLIKRAPSPAGAFFKSNSSVNEKKLRFTLFWWFNKFGRFLFFCIFYEIFIGDYTGFFFFNVGYLENNFHEDYFTSEKWFRLIPVLIFDYCKLIGFNSFFSWVSKIIYMFFSTVFGFVSVIFPVLCLFLVVFGFFLVLFVLFHLVYVSYILVYSKFSWLFFRFFSERYWFLKDYNYGQAILFFFCFFFLYLVNVALYIASLFRYLTRTHGILLDRLDVPNNFEDMVKVMDVKFFNAIFKKLSVQGYFYFLFGSGIDVAYRDLNFDYLKEKIVIDLSNKKRIAMFKLIKEDKVYKYLFKDIYFDKRLVNLQFSNFGGNVLNRNSLDVVSGSFYRGTYYGMPVIPNREKLKRQYKYGKSRMFDYVRFNRWTRYYYYRLGYLKNLKRKYKSMFIDFEKGESAAENFGKIDPNIFDKPKRHFYFKYKSVRNNILRYFKYQDMYEYDYFFFHFKKIFSEPINELFFYSTKVLEFFAFWDKKVSHKLFVDYYELDTERDLFKTVKQIKWGQPVYNGKVVASGKWKIEYDYRSKKVRDRLVGRLVLSYLSNYFKYLLRLIILQNFLYQEYNVRLSRKYFLGPARFLYGRYSLVHLVLKRIVSLLSLTFLGDKFIVRIGSDRLFFNFFKLGIVYIDIMAPLKFFHFCVTAPFIWFYDSFVKSWLLAYYDDFHVEDLADSTGGSVSEEVDDIDELYTNVITLFSRYFLRLSNLYQTEVNFDLDSEDDFLYDIFVGDTSNVSAIAHTNANEPTMIKTHGFNGSLYDNDSRYLEQDGVITPFLFANNAYLKTVLLDFYFLKDSIISFFQRILYMIFFNRVILILCGVIKNIFSFFVLWYLIPIYFWCMFWLFVVDFIWFFCSFVFAWVSFFFNLFIKIGSEFCTKFYIVDIILIVYTAPFLIKKTRVWQWFSLLWDNLLLRSSALFSYFFDKFICSIKRYRFWCINVGVWLFKILKFFVFLGFRIFLFYVVFFILIVNYDNIYDFFSLKLQFNLSFRTFFLLYMIIFFFFLVLCVGPLNKLGRWLWECRYDYLFIVFTLWVLSSYIVSMDLLFTDFWASFDYKNRLYGVDFYENLLDTIGDFTELSLFDINAYNQQFSFDSYHITLEENLYDYLSEYGFFDYNLVKLFSASLVYNKFDTLERFCALGLVYVPDLVFEKELNNFYKALYYKMAFKDYSMALWFDYSHSPSYFVETYSHKSQKWNVPEVFDTFLEVDFIGWDMYDVLYWDREATTIVYPYFLNHDRGDDIRHYVNIIKELYDLDVMETEYFRGRYNLRLYYLPDFSFLGSQAWSYSIGIMQKDPIYLVDSLFMDDDESWFYDEDTSM